VRACSPDPKKGKGPRIGSPFRHAVHFFFLGALAAPVFLRAGFFAAFGAADFRAARSLRLLGRLLPRLPIRRFPFFDFLSPLPMIWCGCVAPRT